ncbi:MAG: QcrA and Rieske domain-containing protein [Gemmatimonadales bacterium]
MDRNSLVGMPADDDACAACAAFRDRRAFLADAIGAVTGALLALGVPSRSAHAMPVVAASGRKEGETVRYPIPASDQVVVDDEHEVILVRRGSSAYAFALACPHQNTALRWHQDVDQFICPKHKSRYRPDGAFISGRATRNMDRLPIRQDGSALLVDVSSAFRSDRDASGWSGAVAVLS